MTNDNDRNDNFGKNLLLIAVIFWLGVLTGAVVALMYMQALNEKDLKSNVLYTPIELSVPGTYKPGPLPWMPAPVYLNR